MNDKKFLTTKEVADLLALPLITIERWKHQGKIPFKIVNHQKCFKKKDILAWAQSHDFVIKSIKNRKLILNRNLLSQAIEWGGIYYDVDGDDIYSIFENAIDLFPFVTNIEKNRLVDELLNREESASTGIGRGIAIPHPRNRLSIGLHDTYVPVLFLRNEIEFNSIDGLPVHVLFMIFTANTTSHLQILSKISYCLQDRGLLSILHNKNKDNNMLQKINTIENAIQK